MNLIPWLGKRSAPASAAGTTLMQLRSEMDRLFDRFFGEWPMGWPDREWFGPGALGAVVPPVDIEETDKEILVKAELPGVEPRNVNVSVTGNTLTLTGQKEEQREERSSGIYRSERRFGSFQRSIPLPEYADPDKVDAEFDNGVLTVRLQKSPTARPRQIPVKAGSGRR